MPLACGCRGFEVGAGARIGAVSDAGESRSPLSRALIARRALASVASLFATGVFVTIIRGERFSGLQWLAPVALTGAPVVAAVSIWSGRIGLQLLARGIWWSLLLLGGLISLSESSDHSGCAVALAGACSLLLSGRSGLDGDRGRFRPVAFRGTLTVALVFAIADTATLLWFGLARAVAEHQFSAILLVPPMVAGIVGLLRLRTWGLLVSLTCNLLVAILAATRTLDLPYALRPLLIGTAIVQLLVPIPMWVAIARRRIPPPDGWRRTKLVVSTAVIIAIAMTSVCFSLLVERTAYTY
jgi:hypothetical protein